MNRTGARAVVAGLLTWIVGTGLAAGCGDNSKICGPGTADEDGDGVCEADTVGPELVCGDGTRLDPISMNRCVPDDSVCGDGTVLVHGRCQDPTLDLPIDLEEGPEPNGLEVGATPAGEVVLEPVGSDGVVIHGCITPVDDATADLDVYLVTVAAPTLIDVVADGVHGLAAGFQAVSTATTPPLASYSRFGLSLATDVARRQLFLPAAGTYHLIMADTRTLLPLVDGANGQVTPPAGNPDGTSCYYVTISQLTPTPVTFDPAAGDSGMIGEDLKFYTASGLESFSTLTEVIASPYARPSLMLLDEGVLEQLADDGVAQLATVEAGDVPLIVADFVYHYSLFASPYELIAQ